MATLPSTRFANRTKERDATLLEGLASGWSLTRACKFAGYVRADVMDWRHADRALDLAIVGAIQEGTEHLEDEAKTMAFDGYTLRSETQSSGGEDGPTTTQSIREVREPGLAKFLLEARDPLRFKPRTRVEHTGNDGAPIAAAVAVASVTLTDEDLARRLVALLAGVPPEKLAETIAGLSGTTKPAASDEDSGLGSVGPDA